MSNKFQKFLAYFSAKPAFAGEFEDIRQAAERGDAVAQNNLGVMYWNGDDVRQNYDEAVRWWRKAAEKGNAQAQNNLGFMYDHGYGVKENKFEAVKWFRKAAEQGYADGQKNLKIMIDNGYGNEYEMENASAIAQYNLGFRHYNNKNYSEAVKWYRKSAEQGNPDAQNNLGFMYDHGYGVKENKSEAVKWFRKAAEQGHADGQKNLKIMIDNGYGNEYEMENASAEAQYNLGFRHYNNKNYSEAVKWYRKAAEQGNPDAQNNLGFMYDHGYGVKENKSEAVKWFRKAAEQGHADGQKNLKIMIDNGYDKQSVDKKNVNEPRNLEEIYELAYKYDEGDGVPVNKSEAVRLYRKAAEQGHAAAQYNLGCMYYNGDGVRQNYSEAMKWYNEAAKQGDLSAYHNIGVMFREGEGVRKDENEAVKWFTFAGKRGVENSINSLFELASKGNAEALFSLHFMYEHGDGVEQNYRESFFCLRKAAERGHTAAQVMLGNKYADENNMSEAARWYSDAVKQGDADAMYLLGHLYGSGEGVKQDLETATMLWVKAAQKGHEGARESLAKFEKMGLPRLW